MRGLVSQATTVHRSRARGGRTRDARIDFDFGYGQGGPRILLRE